MIPCSWKESFGIECMTCGFQRGTAHLIHGEVMDSLTVFPATIPLILTLVLLVLHLIFKFRKGHRWVLGSFILSSALILINYSINVYFLFERH